MYIAELISLYLTSKDACTLQQKPIHIFESSLDGSCLGSQGDDVSRICHCSHELGQICAWVGVEVGRTSGTTGLWWGHLFANGHFNNIMIFLRPASKW